MVPVALEIAVWVGVSVRVITRSTQLIVYTTCNATLCNSHSAWQPQRREKAISNG